MMRAEQQAMRTEARTLPLGGRRACGLQLDGWEADFEGARLFLAGLPAERERSIGLDGGRA